MRYTTVQLPVGGANAGRERVEPNVTVLEYAVGERAEDHTILHVRGHVGLPRDAIYVFAGSIKLTASRETIEHDLILPADRRRGQDFGDLLAACVLVAMDDHAEDFMMDEGKRLVEGDSSMRITFEPLLDPALAVRVADGQERPKDIVGFDSTDWNAGVLMSLPTGDWIVRASNLDLDYGMPIENGVLYVSKESDGGLYKIVEGEPSKRMS